MECVLPRQDTALQLADSPRWTWLKTNVATWHSKGLQEQQGRRVLPPCSHADVLEAISSVYICGRQLQGLLSSTLR